MSGNVVHIVSPTESLITQRGKRHPNLAKYLVDRGISVNYITSTIYHAEKRIFSSAEILSGIQSAPYKISFIHAGLYRKNISLKRVSWNWIFSIRAFIKLMRSAKSGDIILLPSRPPELIFAVAIIKKIKGVKLLLDIEDIWPDAFVVKNPFVRWAFWRYCNFFHRFSVPSFDHSFYVAASFLPWLRRYTNSLPTVFTPLGISEVEMHPSSRKTYSKSIDSITLFYGGALQFQCDIMPVLRAMVDSNRKVNLVLVGDNGTGDRFNEVMDYVEKHSLSCRNYGVLPKSELLVHLKSSDIVIVPMISGGLPKKFYDALGSNKPILCLGEGSVADEVRRFGLGWVCDFDHNQILQIIETIQPGDISTLIGNIDVNIERYLEESSMKCIHKIILDEI